jgi:hypothetical protein
LRHPRFKASCAPLEAEHCPTLDGGEGSEFSDPPVDPASDASGRVSDPPDPQGSEISDGGVRNL